MNELYKRGSVAPLSIPKKEISLMGEAENLEYLEYVNGPTTLDKVLPNRIIFIDNFSTKIVNKINSLSLMDLLFILPMDYRKKTDKPCLLVDNPRHTFAELIDRLYKYNNSYWEQDYAIDSSAQVDPTAIIMGGVSVGSNTKIGKKCFIYPNVTIGPNCIIGDNAIIKSNSVIGQAGFGIYKDNLLRNQHLPHVGGVVIEENVEIGALCTIASGTIHPTVVESFVKTDDHVHIAHNCYISSGTQLAAGATVAGSVFIGENAWIGVGSTIIDQINIGKDSFIGSGANIVKEVEEGATVVGNPGKKIR